MSDLRARLERALGTGFTIDRELGGGGMSRTYLATEEALHRRIVIKVLAPELLAGISVERFRREVLVAAKLQHPHVVPVLTTGETEGLPWFTMPYVEGDSLRRRLETGAVGIGEAVSILRDVARALAYAHAHGIVHRDIKPDNVLLSGGSATVTDFGIAKAISAARTTGGGEGHESLTQAGTSIGTPSYMAPEQALGDPDTDHRADIYSFGAMAFELLAGQPPFVATNPAKLLAAHLGEAPRDVRSLRPDTPPALAELIMRCLEKDPAKRPQQAQELVRVLETVTSSGNAAAVPTVLQGGRIRLGRAIAIWAVATLLVTLTAWAATRSIGLPDWALKGSFGVMLAGLPIIALTAFVQRVTHRVYTATPQMTPGGTPARHGTLATLAIKASPHMSWRRTWMGGAAAIGTFAALVIGFMVLRAFGLGPMGSLRGKGAFGSRETIIVADFRSPPADSALGGTIAEALRTDLAQSTSLKVLTRANVQEVLGLMRRPTESSVPFELAREIATREGAKAVLDGGVVKLGEGYVVTARLVSSMDGTELAAFRETASNENGLIEAIGKLSRAVREKAGESLRTIRDSDELDRVSTASLPALRKYVEGSRLMEGGDPDKGLVLLREAVAIDSTFAMAWRKIAVTLNNERRDRQGLLTAITTAYRHRERLSEMERLLTTAFYWTNGPTPDDDKAVVAYEEALRLDSTSVSALNNLATIYSDRNELEKSEAMFRRVVQLPRPFTGAYINLLTEQIANDRPRATLDSTMALFKARAPESNDLWTAYWAIAFSQGDLDAADSLNAAEMASTPSLTPRQQILTALAPAFTNELRGQISAGLDADIRHRQVTARLMPSPSDRLVIAIDSAHWLARYSADRVRARAIIQRGLARDPMERLEVGVRPTVELMRLAVELGDSTLARDILQQWERDERATRQDSLAQRILLRGAVAMTERRWQDAIDLVREAYALGKYRTDPYLEGHLGRAFEALGATDSAIAQYEKTLAIRTPFPWGGMSYRAQAEQRLGVLYESKGDLQKAADHYARFIQHWEKADPELQPQVKDARARLAAIKQKQG